MHAHGPAARRGARPPGLHLLLLLAALLSLGALQTSGFGLDARTWDTSRDWLSDLAVRGQAPTGGCSIPKPALNSSQRPSCPSLPSPRNFTDEEIGRLGYLLAPKIYFHEREWSFLADPEAWLKNTPLYDSRLQPHTFDELKYWYDNSHFEFMQVQGPQFFASNIYAGNFSARVTTEELRRRSAGDPIDASNRSSAKVWFSVINPRDWLNVSAVQRDALVFNYNLYYPWNGCSNQLLAVNFAGKYQGIEYYMCSLTGGVHEGDWERVSMYTCKADLLKLLNSTAMQADPTQVVQHMQYAQHGWYPEYDCTQAGSCPSELVDGVRRMVLYSSLFSHASYPSVSPLWVYQKVDMSKVLTNFDGVYIADRTSDKGAVWVPTPQNVKHMPLPTPDSNWSWYTYPGSWGGFKYTDTNGTTVQCFHDRLATEGPCDPTNPAASLLVYFLGLVEDVAAGDARDVIWTSIFNSSQVPVSVSELTGPAERPWTYGWLEERVAPIRESSGFVSGDIACPFTGDPTATSGGDDYWPSSPGSVVAFIGAVVALMVAAGLVYTLLIMFPGVADDKLWTIEALGGTGTGTAAAAAGAVQAPAVGQGPGPAAEGVEGVAKDGEGVYSAPQPQTRVQLQEEAEAGARPQPQPQLVLRGNVYHALRCIVFLTAAFMAYVSGVVLVALGTRDMVEALDDLYPLALYDQLQRGLVAVLILFGVLQLLFVASIIFLRSQDTIDLWLGRCYLRNPFRCGGVDRCGYYSQALGSGGLVIMVNVCVVIFAIGFTLWIVRYGFQYGCSMAFSTLFDLTNSLAGQACVNLTAIGADKAICGSDLARSCSLWSSLRLDYILFGGYLLILSHLMFLGCKVHNIRILWDTYKLAQLKPTPQPQPKGAKPAAAATCCGTLRNLRPKKPEESPSKV